MYLNNNKINYDIKKFKKFGYFVSKNHFNKNRINNIKKDLYNYILKSLGINAGSEKKVITKLSKLYKKNFEHYKAVINTFKNFPAFYEICTNKKTLKLLEKCIGSKNLSIVGSNLHVMGKNFITKKGKYNRLASHQDWRYSQASLDGVSLWVPLNDIKKSGFPLEVLPASHEKLHEHELRNNLLAVKNDKNLGDFVSLNLNVGDVVFFSTLLVHRTGRSNNKNGFRSAIGFGYLNNQNKEFINRKLKRPKSGRPENIIINPNNFIKS